MKFITGYATTIDSDCEPFFGNSCKKKKKKKYEAFGNVFFLSVVIWGFLFLNSLLELHVSIICVEHCVLIPIDVRRQRMSEVIVGD